MSNKPVLIRILCRKPPSRRWPGFDLPLPEWYQKRFRTTGTLNTLRASRLCTTPRALRSLRLAYRSLKIQPAGQSQPLLRASSIIFGLSALCGFSLLLGCNTYNPYLGASPTVSSSISSITPSGANAPASHDVSLTVEGSGFVSGSNVTWNTSNSTSINLASNVVSASEIQATIPASLLTTPGTYFVGVIAPGPTSGNNAGNNISNFVPFRVCAASGCGSAVASPSPRIATSTAVSATPLATAAPVGSRYQAFVADSADGSVQTGTGIAEIFLRDSCLGAATCAPQMIPISVGWNGAEPNGPSASPSVTNDGRFVVFASEANNLVRGDSNGWSDIFLRDTCMGAASSCLPTTLRVSIAPDGAEANGASFSPAISPDGRFVIFNSSATNLVRPDFLNSLPATSTPPLFLRDTCFGAALGCIPATSRVIPASALQH